MKKAIFSFAALLLAACTAFISCNTEILQPDDNSVVGKDTYTLTVVATKGDAATKALTLSDKTLNATWSEGDVVEVYENDNHLGTLTTSNFSSDYRTCTLSCELTTPPTGNTLTLKYRSQNYTSQDGTLAYIASYCDYAEASVNVTVSGNTITSSAANFVNQQAIVKFVLKDESGNTLSPTELTIANGTTTVASLPSINSAIYEATANGPGTLFVAIPEVSDEDLSLTAVSSGKTYVFKKSAVTLSNGTYKIITVKMYNELETPLTFEAKTAGATVTLTADPNISFGDNVQYSTDGSTWTTYPSGTGITLENVGNKVQFRGTLTTYSNSTSTGSTFSVSDDCYVYGNVMSLIGGDSFASVTTLLGELTFSRLFLSETKNTKIQSHAYKTIALPATTLTRYCYFDMFFGCSGLTSAPKLPAKTLAHACYENMFYNCSGLTSAPELPATTLADYCYAAMFGRCSGLTSVPTLQASTLKKACYSRLFEGCTGLSTVPTNLLPATIAETQCYQEMFSGCTNLTNVPNLPATNLSTRCYDGMFKGCTSLTTLPADLLPATDLSSASYCYSSMFRGCTGLTSVPTDLLPATTLSQDCYSSMFHSCSNLQNTPNLSAENLASRCYASMFCYCSSLTSGPATLPATTLQNSCYYEMFSSCSNLASCPSLPATTLAQSCYEDMFSYCSNLLSGPNLPATTLAQNCYKRMFVSCSNMTTMGTISATTLAANCCANMFHYCSNLNTAPALLATTLADNCYESMFEACRSLTSLPASLPATTLAPNCYKNMFRSCTSLTTVPADFLPATTLSTSCYYHMFNSCTKLTTAPKLPATTIAPNCYYEMFSRCTDLVTVPTALPATDLTDATFCYSGMFLECTKLETAPNLPATTLSNNCYYAMFKGCSKLKSVTCLATGISESNYLNYTDKWLNGVASTGTFTKASGVDWPRNDNGIPVNWTVNVQ